jgi:outer membrane murein-binding lipoprotein Lpp
MKVYKIIDRWLAKYCRFILNPIYMKKFSLSLLVLLSSSLQGEESVSNAELSRKLDLILVKVGGLEERVDKLESENKAVKREVKQVAESAAEAKNASAALQIPKDEKEKESFFKKLKNQIASQEAKDSGPWAKKESWSQVKKNLTRVQVRRLLGNPHRVKLNNNPRIDQVYLYSGDLDADGEENVGEVNFFNDRVVSYSSPF